MDVEKAVRAYPKDETTALHSASASGSMIFGESGRVLNEDPQSQYPRHNSCRGDILLFAVDHSTITSFSFKKSAT
jgi:hypothetical protein